MINISILRRESGLNRGLIVGTIAIVFSWLYFNRGSIQWLATSILDVSLFNGLMLVSGVLSLVYLAWRYRQSIEVVPGLHRLPLGLVLGCGVGSIATQWVVLLAQLPVGLFLLGSYGLLGLYLAPGLWRRGLPVAIAISCLLPFGVQFGTEIGRAHV